jgi:predicted O-methyltransferase YrrM
MTPTLAPHRPAAPGPRTGAPSPAPPADREAALAASAGLDGWLTRDEAEALYDLAHETAGDGAVVEIGSFVGRSLVCLAAGTLARGGGRVVSIDPHTGSPEHQPGAATFLEAYWDAKARRVDTLPALRRNLAACGLADAAELHRATSDAAAEGWSKPIRVLFIDGGHDYAQVARDLRAWTRWVAPGGAVAIHDYASRLFPGVSRAVDEWLACDPGFRAVRLAGEMLVLRRALSPAADPCAVAIVHGDLRDAWRHAVAGDADARARWRPEESGAWSWEADGVRLDGDGGEWAGLAWEALDPGALAALGAYAVEVTVSGSAADAGLSLGPFRDFLAELEGDRGPRRLRLEVHPAGLWSFSVDGEPQPRQWWDEGQDAHDRGPGTLTLKARQPGTVRFSDLRVTRLPAAECRVSVLLTCHRFLQRLRVTLRGWCAQPLPMGAYEVLVANPASPDGTREHLAAVARSHPHLRVREVPVPSSLATNKGAMINRAFDASRGEWTWISDADCLFSPLAILGALEWMRPDRLGICARRYLAAARTQALLSGLVDPVAEFGALARATGPRGPHCEAWGYCQIVHRSAAERVRYSSRVQNFASTDLQFAEGCRAIGVHPSRVPGLVCLHLDHPFAWYGTRDFL